MAIDLSRSPGGLKRLVARSRCQAAEQGGRRRKARCGPAFSVQAGKASGPQDRHRPEGCGRDGFGAPLTAPHQAVCSSGHQHHRAAADYPAKLAPAQCPVKICPRTSIHDRPNAFVVSTHRGGRNLRKPWTSGGTSHDGRGIRFVAQAGPGAEHPRVGAKGLPACEFPNALPMSVQLLDRPPKHCGCAFEQPERRDL